MKPIFLMILATVSVHAAWAADFFDQEFTLQGASHTQILVGTYLPRPTDRATVIYLHGFADRFNNHEELLSQLHEDGHRVIAFDYPGHGGSTGAVWAWSAKSVAGLVKTILNSPQMRSGPLAVDRHLPVILVGWSTGATLALRTAQAWGPLVIPEDMRLAGVVAIAPALMARPFVGDGISRLGVRVRPQDLTPDASAIKYGPRPSTTLAAGRFVATLFGASISAKLNPAPEVPLMVLLADAAHDHFSYPNMAAEWVRTARASQKPVYGFQCHGGHHGLEFEPGEMGDLVVEMISSFARATVEQRTEIFGQVPDLGIHACQAIR